MDLGQGLKGTEMKRRMVLILAFWITFVLCGCTTILFGGARVVLLNEQIKQFKNRPPKPNYKYQYSEEEVKARTGALVAGSGAQQAGVTSRDRTGPTLAEQRQMLEALKHSLDASIGRLDYDGALLLLGKPHSLAPGGQIFVATWRRSQLIAAASAGGITVPIHQGEELQLIFDKTSRTLISWSYCHR